jgi:hypothetical protein
MHGICPCARKCLDHGYKMTDDAVMTGSARQFG